MLRPLIALVLALLTAGCGGSDTAEQSTSTGQRAAEASTDTDSHSVQFVELQSTGSKQIPADWPTELTFPAGAKVTSVATNPEGAMAVTVTTSLDVDAIAERYEQQLGEYEQVDFPDNEHGETTQLQFHREDRIVTITIASSGRTRTLAITVMPKD